MAEVSQKIKYVKLDDGVSFSLVRTNPKLTTNTKLMYNGKKMYMESYASDPLLNRMEYKNVSVKQNSTYNRDIANFLIGSGPQAYAVHQNFSDTTISGSYDNQYENFYWCGAEHINSSFYSEEIGFIAPLYLREKLPNYFLIFRLNTPSNYNLNVDKNGKELDSTFDFKKDILDNAVLIKTFDLREESESVLGNYIHNYINQEEFEFDKSMHVNFSTGEVTYYGINKASGVLINRVESFKNELLKNDNAILEDDRWFTEGFERNNLIFPYIINIEYLFDDENFKNKDGEETYDFARYIGLYCNNIEFGEFSDFNELLETEDNAIYYFEDNKGNLHRYTLHIPSDSDGSENEYIFKIDGKESELFDKNLISGFEKEKVTGYAEPLDIYEGFINRAQYAFEILKPFDTGDWIGIEYKEVNDNGDVIVDDSYVYFADHTFNKDNTIDGNRFFVGADSTVDDIAKNLTKCVNNNKKCKFEARCSGNVVAFYAKREGKKYNGSENGGSKILIESSLLYNKKISLPISNYIKHVNDHYAYNIKDNEKIYIGNYYIDYFCGACDLDIDIKKYIYKNVFKIYTEECEIFDKNRYLKTNNGNGRRICSNIAYIDAEGNINKEYRLVIIDDKSEDKIGDSGYDVSVSSTYQVEILDIFKANHGILSWFPVKDFDFDINYSTYGQYVAFADECNNLSKKIIYTQLYNTKDTYGDSDFYSTYEDSVYGIKELAKSPFFDDYGNYLDTEYDYYYEKYHPDLCLKSKSVPYISKWGYYDEQKDSCENSYRLNVNKVFGVNNLSANIYSGKCDEKEYTHSMPYYMILNTPDYNKEYQYIISDETYIINNDINKKENKDAKEISLDKFNDCVNYWIDMFKRTDEDMFSYFFSGKKYGKRFDRKYSRLLGGDKFNNPSTLFRGVKFEAVRQFNGVEKRSSEYNDYRFSFVYIPIMINTFCYSSTVHFIKNDTFKFIVGIIFVNTMIGVYDHNIFNGRVDYFNKGFLYAGCKDIISAESKEKYTYTLKIGNETKGGVINDILNDNYDISKLKNAFHIWFDENDKKTMFVTKTKNATKPSDIIGEFYFDDCDSDFDFEDISNKKLLDYIGRLEKIKEYKYEYIDLNNDGNHDGNSDSDEEVKFTIKYIPIEIPKNEDIEDGESDGESEDKKQTLTFLYEHYYDKYDTTICGYKTLVYLKEVLCEINAPYIKIDESSVTEICDIEWDYLNHVNKLGYSINVGTLRFKEGTLRNILYNIGEKYSIIQIRFHDENENYDRIFYNKIHSGYINDVKGKIPSEIIFNTVGGDVKIIPDFDETNNINYKSLVNIEVDSESDNTTIENLLVDILIKDEFDNGVKSLGLKEYFSVFNQLSVYNIINYINNDYNVKYYSTVEDNKYKIRVIKPDCIEIKDIYEAIPNKILENNNNIIGTINIVKKTNVNNIKNIKINRYSGFYNPIFNDMLYYDDYKELPYSNTHIDYDYNDEYGSFGIIKNMYYHKTNVNKSKSNKIINSFAKYALKPVYPLINEYALGYRDYNIFSSNWDYGYFISQDDLKHSSVCSGIGSMKDGLCMFGSKYLNLPDYIFIDTFENGKQFDENMTFDVGYDIDSEILYREINNRTVKFYLFIEKRLKRYLKEKFINDGLFSKYINETYSFGNKGTIEDDIEEYIDKNILKYYKIDKVHLYVKGEIMRINNKKIENDYLKYVNKDNLYKSKNGFEVISVDADGGVVLKDGKFSIGKMNTSEFDKSITYNLKSGFKESFGFGVSFKRK
jgi:hypothetical protein